ncbi:MAG: DM13 domain-containing protein [Spirosomataceae bacterium]|mgnify:CR=1 FL=1
MKTATLLLLIGITLSSCVKNQELVPTNQQPPTTTNPPTAIGEFVSNAHATSGTVKVLEDAQDKSLRYLVFENFKTDAGPDLRVYLSEDTKTTGFVEVSKLDKTGTFTLTIPSSANLDKQRYVLIWCKQFSVLFGNAPLK